VRCLLSFMGACMGWACAWEAFIDTALLAYLAGTSAQSLFDALDPEEFSQAGCIFRAAASATVNSDRINAEAFARYEAEIAGLSGFLLSQWHVACDDTRPAATHSSSSVHVRPLG
jgi:hypothetical protein